jgi:short-subunit dehydrogenase
MVTGASSGIGQAYVERLAADGWRLLVVGRSHDRLHELAERMRNAHGAATRAIQADLSRSDDLQRVCQEIQVDPVDMLINNAGLGHYMPFAELPPDRARELVDLNALAPVLLTRAAVEGMIARGGGAVINVASILAFSGTSEAAFLPERAVYAGTKSFLVTFSEVLASEVVPLGVRVQVVCPGVVRSEFHSRQGIDMSAVPRMEPDQVVEASLTDLANGVVVSVPGLADVGALTGLEAASEELVSVARTADLPARYRIKPV